MLTLSQGQIPLLNVQVQEDGCQSMSECLGRLTIAPDKNMASTAHFMHLHVNYHNLFSFISLHSHEAIKQQLVKIPGYFWKSILTHYGLLIYVKK